MDKPIVESIKQSCRNLYRGWPRKYSPGRLARAFNIDRAVMEAWLAVHDPAERLRQRWWRCEVTGTAGRYAVLSQCEGTKATLYPDREAAEQALHDLNRAGCGGRRCKACYHRLERV